MRHNFQLLVKVISTVSAGLVMSNTEHHLWSDDVYNYNKFVKKKTKGYRFLQIFEITNDQKFLRQ